VNRHPLDDLLEAYSWLASQEIACESRTSRILHDDDVDPLERAYEEWDELLGVLDGSHVHQGFEHDAALEAGQVMYWTCLYQVREGRQYAAASEGLESARFARGGAGEISRYLATAVVAPDTRSRLDALWSALGAACYSASLDPAETARRDLAELSEKGYMRAYFDAGRAE